MSLFTLTLKRTSCPFELLVIEKVKPLFGKKKTGSIELVESGYKTLMKDIELAAIAFLSASIIAFKAFEVFYNIIAAAEFISTEAIHTTI